MLILFSMEHLGVEIMMMGYCNTHVGNLTGMAAHIRTHKQSYALHIKSVWHSSAVSTSFLAITIIDQLLKLMPNTAEHVQKASEQASCQLIPHLPREWELQVL